MPPLLPNLFLVISETIAPPNFSLDLCAVIPNLKIGDRIGEAHNRTFRTDSIFLKMANSNPGSGGQPTRNVKTLFDRSKFVNARKPTTINISNSINPVPQVPGQNTYPPARGPRVTNPQDRGLSIADLRARQLPTLSARQLTGLLFSPNSSTENQRAAMGQTASVPIRQHTFALPPIPAPYERPVAANEDVIPDDNDDDDDDDDLFTGDVDESAVDAQEYLVITEQASRASQDHGPCSPNEVVSSLESDGDSDAGVITYDDVAACDNDVITDDSEGEGENTSREPPNKSNKRKRDLEAILGPNYRPSDDSDDDLEDDLDNEDSDDSEQRAAKRAKARGKRPAPPPLPPRSPTPPELQASEGRPVPHSFAEMSDADKVMFEWWESGEKGWAAITHEVNRLTGGNEDNMEIATRYEILRRYLHGKEKIIIVSHTSHPPLWCSQYSTMLQAQPSSQPLIAVFCRKHRCRKRTRKSTKNCLDGMVMKEKAWASIGKCGGSWCGRHIGKSSGSRWTPKSCATDGLG